MPTSGGISSKRVFEMLSHYVKLNIFRYRNIIRFVRLGTLQSFILEMNKLPSHEFLIKNGWIEKFMFAKWINKAHFFHLHYCFNNVQNYVRTIQLKVVSFFQFSLNKKLDNFLLIFNSKFRLSVGVANRSIY